MDPKNMIIQNTNEFTDKPSLDQVTPFALKQTIDPALFGKVAVLLGGRSAERKISLESGKACLEALLRQGVNAHPLDPDNDFAVKLRLGEYDRAFVMLHGREGEDGTIQGVLETMQIPYTGSGVAASALAMNKSRAKLVMHALDIPTPIFGVAFTAEQAKKLAEKMGLPVSIKPVNEGSSIGVTRVDSFDKLENAYTRAAVYGEVMVERWVAGDDFFVSILHDEVLPSVQVKPANQFYDFNAKYESNKTQYLCPSPHNFSQEKELQDICYRAFRALGCEGWGRVDVVRDKEGKFWVLEVNTIPGMTSHSLVPMSAKASGLSFDDLVMAILQTSMKEKRLLVGKLAQS